MNEKIDLTEILKNCPKDTEFYSTLFGNVRVKVCNNTRYPILLLKCIPPKNNIVTIGTLTETGKYARKFDGECTLFPSKDQRDWSKFTAPWYKKKIFDPKTLKPFDRVLVRNDKDCTWKINIYSHKNNHDKNYHDKRYPYVCMTGEYSFCIPYNDDTKHLVGTTDEAPDFYKYWED